MRKKLNNLESFHITFKNGVTVSIQRDDHISTIRAKLRDYKDWIQERADDIAEEEHGKDFCDLPLPIQHEVYKHASSDYKEAYSDWCDRPYEQMRDTGDLK